MNNSREILDLYSPVKEITFNESLGIYMEQNGRRSVPNRNGRIYPKAILDKGVNALIYKN